MQGRLFTFAPEKMTLVLSAQIFAYLKFRQIGVPEGNHRDQSAFLTGKMEGMKIIKESSEKYA